MKQLSFLTDPSVDNQPKKNQTSFSFWKLYIDGASRNNPGPAGAGIVIIKDGKTVVKKGYYLDTKTNNQAEYLALLIGLFHIKECGVGNQEPLAIYSDSQLMICQLSGVYKIKNLALKRYYDTALSLLRPYNYALHHILRDANGAADEAANLGIDKRIAVPQSCITMMRSYDIEL